MTFNVALAERVLAQIEAHPETWDQSAWRCGTGMCFAGWVCTLEGGRWAFPAQKFALSPWLHRDPSDPSDDVETVGGVRGVGGVAVVAAYARAARLLGLTDSHGLFDGANTLDDLRRLVAELAAGAP